MKHHLFHVSQILTGLAVGLFVIGLTAARALPVWLVQIIAPWLLLALFLCLSALLVLFFLWAGMVLAQREHDAQMDWLVARATRNARKVK